MKEFNIRDALKSRVEAYGGEIRAVAWLGRKHAPDVLCLFPSDAFIERSVSGVYFNEPAGSHTFVETKRPGKSATEGQAREHVRMRAAGCKVLMITTLAELDEWLPPL